MEVHLLQDAPTTVYDAYKARFEGIVEEQDYIEADDYSDMQTNQWESTVDVSCCYQCLIPMLMSYSRILSLGWHSLIIIEVRALPLEALRLPRSS